MCQAKDILNTPAQAEHHPLKNLHERTVWEQIQLKLFSYVPPGTFSPSLGKTYYQHSVIPNTNSAFSSRSQLTCESASAYTRTMSSVPEGRTKARASLYFFTRSLIASWSPGGVTACLSASVVLITLLSATCAQTFPICYRSLTCSK